MEKYQSGFDRLLERSKSVAGIAVPILIFFLGQEYSRREKQTEFQRASALDAQHRAEEESAQQQRTASLLLPLLTSISESQKSAGLTIYNDLAKNGQAPPMLFKLVESIYNDPARKARAAPKPSGLALAEMASIQTSLTAACNKMADGVYLHYQD